MKQKRKNYSPEEKVRIVRLHLLEGKPVSDLCEEHGIHPTLFYQWQKQLFEKGTAAFTPQSPSRVVNQVHQKLASLEAKLRHKDEVIAEIMSDHVRLKKELGED